MFVLRPLLFAAIAQADVVGVFDDGREFEAPGVEESSLESYRTRTHDDESGNQYNFVEQAAREAKGAAGGKTLSDLLAGGAEVEVVDGAAASGLHDLIKQMFAAATKPSKPEPAALPSVPPDTPVSQLLKMIRQSTHDIPPVAPRRASPGRSSDAGEASYLDHMDVTGLELLEAELLQKVPSLPSPHPSPRRHPLLTEANPCAVATCSGGERAPRQERGQRRAAAGLFELRDGRRGCSCGTSHLAVGCAVRSVGAQAGRRVDGARPKSGQLCHGTWRSAVQPSMRPTRHPGPFHDHAATMPPPHLAAHLATARHAPLAPRPPAAPPPAPPRPTQQAAAGSGASADDDGVDGYAERLSREAQQRERPADEEGEEAEGGAASIQDLLQQMMGGGGADGPVVKFEVVMGDGSGGGAGGGGGLSGLLESLRSQMEGNGDDGDQEEADDDDATDAL